MTDTRTPERKAYDEAMNDYHVIAARYRAVAVRYRCGLIDDTEFLAARRAMDAAGEAADEAETVLLKSLRPTE